VKTDKEIMEIVAGAMVDANGRGESWPEFVERDLKAAGVALHDEQPEDNDEDIIVRLADGREVYAETDGSGDYGITNLYRDYWAEIDHAKARETRIRARNWFEAEKQAQEWAKIGDWEKAETVRVNITLACHGTKSIQVEVGPRKAGA